MYRETLPNNIEAEITTSSHNFLKFDRLGKDLAEFAIAAILFMIAGYIFKQFIVNDPYDNPFNLTGMGILGAIGLAAFLVCLSFEGDLPGTLEGLLGRAFLLILAMEFSFFIPILIISYIISAILLFFTFKGGISAVALGMVGIICLPFWGVIILLFIEMLFGGGSRRSGRFSKNKETGI